MAFAQYASGVFALAGTIVGADISFWAQVYISRANQALERRAVASAIAAEIEAYIRVVQMRTTFERAEEMIYYLKQGKPVPMKGFGVPVDDKVADAFPVFHASIGKIGLLGSLAGDVATFYVTASAVRATAQAGERGDFEGIAPADKATFIREELDVFQECVVLGRRLINQLKAV